MFSSMSDHISIIVLRGIPCSFLLTFELNLAKSTRERTVIKNNVNFLADFI